MEKILIVDDNSSNLKILGSILDKENYNVAVAKDGESALKIAEKTQPDLILLDIMMPEIDGFEVCEKLKNNELTKNIPVIFLTAKTETEDIIEGFKKGGVDYIVKPFKKDELLVRINTHLELRRSKEIIRTKNRELQEIIATKDKMFAVISHDLQSPLSSIKSIMQIITDEPLDFGSENFNDIMRLLRTSIDNTSFLLENLLNWAMGQRNQLAYIPEIIQLKVIAEENILLFMSAAKEKNIDISTKISDDQIAHADRNMINLILRNLISNALKFTNQNGKITISANTKNKFVEISVKDNGIGIKEENKKKLFKENLHLTTYGTGNEKGSGLGLNLCKDLVELNYGGIRFESKLGSGSTFYVILPTEDPKF